MKRKRDHKIRLVDFTHKRSVCDEPGCKFRGQLASQGNCFHRLDQKHQVYLRMTREEGESFLREAKALRAKNKQKSARSWLRYLEGHIVCQWMNGRFTLDELIELRAENDRLRFKLGKRRRQ
jgi:hypothetical protein